MSSNAHPVVVIGHMVHFMFSGFKVSNENKVRQIFMLSSAYVEDQLE